MIRIKDFSIEMKWAFYFALMSLAWMLLEKAVGLHGKYIDYHLYLTNLFAIPAVWFMILALKDKRKNFYAGSMSYFQGLKSGVVLSFFIALLSPLTQWIVSYIITPEYFPNVIKRSVELGYYPSTEAAEAHFNFHNFALSSTIFAFIFGVITTIVVMFFIKSKTK